MKNNKAKGKNHYAWSGGLRQLTTADDALGRDQEDQESMKSWILKNCKKIGKSGCWEWQKFLDKNGYSQINIKNTVTSAHRIAFVLFVGPTNGLHVLHKCDNGKCVNPDHLFLGTHLDNMRDAAKKGRLKNRPKRIGREAPNYKHGRYSKCLQ